MASSAATQQPSRLQNVEAQRIMAILEETHSKLELLSRVPPLQLPDEGDLRLVLGPEVLQVLQEQAMLEQQYEMVSAPQYEQRQDGDGGAAALPDFETLDDELRHSTRVVCRMLREAPMIIERLEETGSGGPAPAMRKFLSTFLELKSQTFQKLSTSVEEEKSKEDWFLEISAREEKASQTLRQLQKEIKAEKTDRERQASAGKATIQKLRDELSQIKESTVAETRALEMDTKAAEGADKTAFTSKEETLTAELKKLTSELKARKEENKESEEQLRKKKVKYESEASNWIAKYDQDMEEKDKEICAIRAIYEEERKELNRLEDYFNKLLAEREAALAEERKKAEERARQAAQQATLNKAATMLQTIWRGKCARRDMEKKKSGGKGKGKGGKKKK